MIIFQHLLIQLPLQHLHLVFILLAHRHHLISNSHPYCLHLLQILALILAVKQVCIFFDDNLLEVIFAVVFLNEVPDLLRVTLEQSHGLEDLVNGHVEEAVLRRLQPLEVLQARVDLLLGVVELEGLEVEPRLHLFQPLVEQGLVLLGDQVGLVEKTHVVGGS